MADLVMGYDPTRAVGERLAPEVVAEIEAVAPSNLEDGSVTENKIADAAITASKFAPGAVDSDALLDAGIQTGDLADQAVTGPKIADDTITPTQTGDGVATAASFAGADIPLTLMPITSADFGTIAVPDPDTLYFIY